MKLKFITKRRFLIFSDKLSKVIEVKKVLTKFRFIRSSKTGFSHTLNDGLSEYCENIFTNELRILNGVVFLSTFFTKKVVVFGVCPLWRDFFHRRCAERQKKKWFFAYFFATQKSKKFCFLL